MTPYVVRLQTRVPQMRHRLLFRLAILSYACAFNYIPGKDCHIGIFTHSHLVILLFLDAVIQIIAGNVVEFVPFDRFRFYYIIFFYFFFDIIESGPFN